VGTPTTTKSRQRGISFFRLRPGEGCHHQPTTGGARPAGRNAAGNGLRSIAAALRPIALAAWDITKEHNVGSLVRTAHATAASEVILVGDREWNVAAARTTNLYTRVRPPARPRRLRRPTSNARHGGWSRWRWTRAP